MDGSLENYGFMWVRDDDLDGLVCLMIIWSRDLYPELKSRLHLVWEDCSSVQSVSIGCVKALFK